MNILSIYINFNIFLVIATSICLSLSFFYRSTINRFSAKNLLQTHKYLLGVSFILAAGIPLIPQSTFELPVAQVFTELGAGVKEQAILIPQDVITLYSGYNLQSFAEYWHLAYWLATGILFLRYLYRLSIPMRLAKKSHVFKKTNHLTLYVSDEVGIPFGFSFLRRSLIFIPIDIFASKEKLKIILKHELFHIKNKDTLWLQIFEVLKIMNFWNPFIYIWASLLNHDQEFFCDESLIVKNRISQKNYASCLFEIAAAEITQKMIPVGATGIVFGRSHSTLYKRIKMMKNSKNYTQHPSWYVVFLMASTIMLAGISLTVRGYYQGDTLNIDRLESIVKKTNLSSDFPVDVNEPVLKQINRFTSTKKGRTFVKKSLKNYKAHKDLIQKYIKDYGVPEELASIPFIESGYENISAGASGIGAGLWMFIPQTARRYDLTVSEKKDDRLNIDLETVAAMRYLTNLYKRFNSWPLALMGYNCGENQVQKGIDQTGSRDPWTLIKNGVTNDKDYLAKIMAGVIIMKNPHLVK
ncbi:MAG: transglycosylase SLT domain-containing protein [Deltaproteobacteria bacterium]|nr:transglycosylase SLT domain-containing protein [Deltaproteobacteria bacterium]